MKVFSPFRLWHEHTWRMGFSTRPIIWWLSHRFRAKWQLGRADCPNLGHSTVVRPGVLGGVTVLGAWGWVKFVAFCCSDDGPSFTLKISQLQELYLIDLLQENAWSEEKGDIIVVCIVMFNLSLQELVINLVILLMLFMSCIWFQQGTSKALFMMFHRHGSVVVIIFRLL